MPAKLPYSCYIGLGANLGDRERTIRLAVKKIAELEQVEVRSVSSLYETVPWGRLDQPCFLNAVAELQVSMPPQALMAELLSIEKALGRVRHEHWGARTIDLDMLYIPDFAMSEENLTLPHRFLLERAFVLIPFEEIAPDLRHAGKSISEHCDTVGGKEGIKRLKSF